jgi:hypothetical protein
LSEQPKGVVYAPPPPEILPAIVSQIDEFLKGLPDGRDATFALSIDTDRGINGAVVARYDGRVDLAGALWIGKTWGQPARAGIALTGSWNWKG